MTRTRRLSGGSSGRAGSICPALDLGRGAQRQGDIGIAVEQGEKTAVAAAGRDGVTAPRCCRRAA